MRLGPDSARQRSRVIIALVLAIVGYSEIFAAQPKEGTASSPNGSFECRWAAGPIEIDGKMDDADWQHAQLIGNFSLPWLKEKTKGRTATRARLLWDRENLYFFADMEDSDLFADVVEHDGKAWTNDVFELFFKPSEDKTGYYEFQVNAAGTELDMFLPSRSAGGYEKHKAAGEFHMKTAVSLRGTLNQRTDKDEGWSVEGRIPWADFLRTGGVPTVGETWHFALCRYDYNVNWEKPDLSTCAPLTVPSFHQHEDYAPLKFLGMESNPLKKPGIMRREPLTTSKVVGSPDPPLPYRVTRAFPDLKLTNPIGLDRVPDSNTLLLIAQVASGPVAVLQIKDDPKVSAAEKFLDLPTGGVAYGIAFHPQFKQNGYMYVGWNGALDGSVKKTRVTRYTIDLPLKDDSPLKLDPASALEIISWDSNGHNGGDLEFGLDGKLYISSGDGTSDSDTDIRGQDLTQLTAKVLRIDVDHPEPGKQYSVPKDNPFIGQKDGDGKLIVPETWAYGLRNPWRLTVDPKTGHVWVGNNGQDLWEQVYFVRKGDNYGWSVYEGGHPFYTERRMGPHPHVLPAADHPHSEARSLTGGLVYYGEKFPDLRGAYIYGDHSTGRIWGIRHDGEKVTWNQLLADTSLSISGFGLDSHGELLIADYRGGGDGAYYYLEPIPPLKDPPTFPRKLSESGLFSSVARHAMQPGVIPYSVNSPLWSDGSYKERFMAIPHKEGEDTQIEFLPTKTWKFPDETVLVKSFALETTAGDPTTRRWIETRFFTKQEGEWAGYSYIWNDEQTDAELVAAEGLDREYEIRVPRSREYPEGLKRQVWHYPSRVECMVCHSRAANFVLGVSGMQLNKEHDYGGVVDHQYRVLEQLGLLKIKWQQDAVNFLKEDLKKQGKDDAEITRSVAGLKPAAKQRAVANNTLFAGSPDRYPRLADPYDASLPLEDRVKSYLHVNCASCHVNAGGGNAQMQLDYAASLDKMKIINEVPVHHKFGIEDARLVAPGQPERSILLHRMAARGPKTGQMPQLGTSLVDEQAVKLVTEWIKSLPASSE